MPDTEATIEGKIGKFPTYAPKLTEAQKHRVCELFAQFHTPTQIQRILKAEYNVDIGRSSLCIYPREKKWKPLVDRLRQEWALGLMDLPLAHKRGRMEELTRLYKHINHNETKLSTYARVVQSLAVLREMREEMDEKTSHFTTIFAQQIHQYSDEELLARRDELVKRLDELRGMRDGRKIVDATTTEGTNGARSGIQSETAGHDAQEPVAPGGTPDAAGDGARGVPESPPVA